MHIILKEEGVEKYSKTFIMVKMNGIAFNSVEIKL